MKDRFQVDDAEMRIRRTLAESAGTSLRRIDQETAIRFFGDADRYHLIRFPPGTVGVELCATPDLKPKGEKEAIPPGCCSEFNGGWFP